jgi:HK97 family phage major capsid protein
MTIKEQFQSAKAKAQKHLDEMEKALAAEDMELYETEKSEYQAALSKANTLSEHLNLSGELTKMADHDEEEEEEEDDDKKTQKGINMSDNSNTPAMRVPFTEEENQEQPEATKKSFAESVAVLRYGEIDNGAVEATVKSMYGTKSNYYEKRQSQKQAFNKYLRYGYGRMSSAERNSLEELVYTEDTIKSELLGGHDVNNIKSNLVVQQESSLELGGALVPEDWRAEVISRMMGFTTVRPRARVVSTARDAIEWPQLKGGDDRHTSNVRVTWIDAEVPTSAEVAATNFETASIKVPVDTVMARTDVSRNLLEDSGVPVVNLVQELFSEAFALDEDEQFIIGHGGGRPQGVLGNRVGNVPSPVDGVSTVNSGHASQLTADGIFDLVYDLPAQYLGGAIHVGSRFTFRDVRKLKDGGGDYLWQQGIAQGAPPILIGYDYNMNEVMPRVAADAYPLIFGNWRGYLIADRVGLTIERVSDTDTIGKNKIALFGRRRLGGQVMMPWMFRVQKVSA